MDFCSFGKVVTLHLYSSSKNLCNQGGRVSLSRPACHILNFADKPGITPIPLHMLMHLNVEANYLSQGRLVTEFPPTALAAFQLWGQLELDPLASSNTNQCQHYYTLENPLLLGVLGLKYFHPSLGRSGE